MKNGDIVDNLTDPPRRSQNLSLLCRTMASPIMIPRASSSFELIRTNQTLATRANSFLWMFLVVASHHSTKQSKRRSEKCWPRIFIERPKIDL
ncbi:hypothetical protein U1Q18_050507 [Sarracenia purpurea var. burkii]